MATMIKDLGFGEAELAQLKVGFTLLDRCESVLREDVPISITTHLPFPPPAHAMASSDRRAVVRAAMVDGGARAPRARRARAPSASVSLALSLFLGTSRERSSTATS